MGGRAFECRTTRQAVGFRKGNHIKLVCAIDPETFYQIRRLAVKQEISVAEKIRQLIEWGLEAEPHTTRAG